MRVVRAVAPFLLVALALAGCSEGPNAPAELVIQSAPPEEIRSGEGLGQSPATEAFERSASVKGHIAGVVVDEAIRPIAGAKVRLPGMNMERPTEQDGSFGFVDLYPGPYYLTVEKDGFYMAEALLEVTSEEFTRAKVVLTAIPPPEPYRVQQSFDGFADVSDVQGNPFWGFVCNTCSFDFYLERAGLRTVVFEAVQESPVQGSGFTVEFASFECCDTYASAASSNPFRMELKGEDAGPKAEDHFRLHAYPTSFPAPELNKRFQVFVTAFYNEAAPTGWSFVNGDP